MKDKIITIIGFVFVLFVVSNLICNKPTPQTDYHENNIQLLSGKIDSLQLIIVTRLDSIQALKSEKVFIRNIYYEKANEIDSIYSDSILIYRIREQLERLGTAKFE